MNKKHTISFSTWKEKSRRMNLTNAHVSMDGEKQKVIVKFLK